MPYIKKYMKYGAGKMRRPSTFKQLIKDDEKLSDIMTGRKIPHYRYFTGNMYYFNLKGKYGFN